MRPPPAFLFFDMGNVLLHFDHRRAARQMAEVADVDAQRVWQLVFAGGLNDRYDAGDISTDELYDTFCRETESRPNRQAWEQAAADIFAVNVPMKALVARLRESGYRLGVLSNTCELHWSFIASDRYSHLPGAFETVVLSCRERLVKPQRELYLRASQRVGVPPERIFYTDDVAANVTGAREAGWDAELFTTANDLARQLHQRGLRFSY